MDNVIEAHASESVTTCQTHRPRVLLAKRRSLGIKRCWCCTNEKPFAAFNKSKSRHDGLSPKCRECERDYRLAHIESYQTKERERSAARRKANPEKINAEARKRYNSQKEAIRQRKRREDYPEKLRASGRKWREANREKANIASRDAKRAARKISREKDKLYRENNKTRRMASGRAYRDANREKIKTKAAAYIRKNRGKINTRTARRTAAKLQAIPLWANRATITAIYSEAARLTQETGVPHEVDHIYPLQSKWMCGLHCEANLQILPRTPNRSKGNRSWPGMEWCISPC